MHITDKQFATILLDSDMQHNTLVNALIISDKLLKRYGQSIYSNAYQDLIADIAPEVTIILKAAKQANKASPEQIRHITKIVKQLAKEYKPNFVIQSPDTVTKELETYLQNKIQKADIDTQKDKTNAIMIQ